MSNLISVKGILLLFVCVLLFACDNAKEHSGKEKKGASLHTELGGSAQGYERACGSREFIFPQDHGAHSTFRNEWWYVTGNLENRSGARYGFHATFFRIANKASHNSLEIDSQAVSKWSANEFYMAHFAITEAGASQVSAHERFARAAAGLAGAEVLSSDTLVKVWLDDWQLEAEDLNGETVWRLSLKEGDDAINLTLRSQKPPTLQGKNGYSQKSADPCNSSYYYSLTRMQAMGKIEVKGTRYDVVGTAWLDREWSSSALADDQVGWDWFALQLNDGRDIMYYQLRKADGTRDPYSYAVEIDTRGVAREVPVSQLKLYIDDWWQSSSGARYPVSGKIHRADTNETIVFKPLIKNQELNLTVRYWEGAIDLSDNTGRVIGRGYLELTGY